MKKIFALLAVAIAAVFTAKADDKPVDYNRLPAAVHAFVSSYYPDVQVTLSTKDDDLLWPDYTVLLVNGVKLSFDNSGKFEKIYSADGVPSGLVPVQICDYVKARYPEASVVEYEVGRHGYEVKLSNRMELKFNKNWVLVEIDD